MARTNFQYEKRQRELEKKKRAEEKVRRRLEAKHQPAQPVATTPLEQEAAAGTAAQETRNQA